MARMTIDDVSSPLQHLLAIDFGPTSPISEISPQGKITSGMAKKVRFLDQVDVSEEDYDVIKTEITHTQTIPKSILRRKLSIEEQEELLSSLTTEEQFEDEYSDFSDSDNRSSDTSEKVDDPFKGQERVESDDNFEQEDDDVNEPFPSQIEVSFKDNESLKSTSQNKLLSILSDIKLDAQANRLNDETSVLNEMEIISSNSSDDIHEGSDTFIKQVMPESFVQGVVRPTSLAVKSHDVIPVKPEVKTEKRIHTPYSPRKPTLHFCVVPLSRQESNNSGTPASFKVATEELPNKCFMKQQVSVYNKTISFTNPLDSGQTVKLNSMLRDHKERPPSARELKAFVFDAWHKVKNTQKLVLPNQVSQKHVGKVKTMKPVKSDESEKAFIYWKQKKELDMKRKKRKLKKFTGQSATSAKEQKKRNDEERNVVYKLWKQKKDEELKQLQEESKVKKLNEINKVKEKEVQKQDAIAAFNAWKAIKKRSLEDEKFSRVIEVEKEKQKKEEEKKERDKEAEEAYYLWLEMKEKLPSFGGNHSSKQKPPWNPPG